MAPQPPTTNGVPGLAVVLRHPSPGSSRGLGAPFDTVRELVRPYVLTHEDHERRRREQQRRQRERRRVSLLALDGVDAGPEWTHGVLVGARR